MSVIH